MLTITNYFNPFMLNFAAACIIYTGLLFMSGQLLPSLLETVYNNTNLTIRTIIAVLVCTTPANVLISHIFKSNPAAVAGITNIMAVVIVLTIIAVLIDNIKINASILISMAFAMVACGNLIYQLQK
jgi:hypothetical protein